MPILQLKGGQEVDYRIPFTLKNEIYSEDVYAYSNFVHKNIIRSIGILIGKDVLSARLGVSKSSPDWEDLIKKLDSIKYKGIFSDSYDRWWANGLVDWFNINSSSKGSLRRLTAEERCNELMQITSLNGLEPLSPISRGTYSAKSLKFWTICKDTSLPIDYVDGFELYERELLPWQEPEYISFLGKSNKGLMSYVKPNDKSKIRELEKSMKP